MNRRAIGRFALLCVSLVVSWIAAELVYRWSQTRDDDVPSGADDAWREQYRRMNTTIYRRSQDPLLVYEPVPGASVEMEYGAAGFNMQSMRDDRAFDIAPRSDKIRVAIVGDSLVWSEFLPLHDSVPRRTEEALGDRYEVLAFGVTGYDTEQEAEFYERTVRPLSPSVVVVVYCMNDMMIMSGPFERFANDADRARKTAQETRMERVAPLRRETLDDRLARREEDAISRLFARLTGMFTRWQFDREYIDEYTASFALDDARERTERALTRLAAAIEADGAVPILVISPVLEAWDDYHWDAIHEGITRAAHGAGFTVVDPLEEWRALHTAEEMRISGDNLHYDGSGARVLGETIAEAVSLTVPR